MVQLLLRRIAGNRRPVVAIRAAVIAMAIFPTTAGASKPKQQPQALTAPVLQLDGGRRLVFERSFTYEREVKPKRGFWNKLLDIVAGEPEFHSMVRPYSVVSDSRGRIIVSDPGAFGIHIFDFERQRYKFVSHLEGKDALRWPQCVAVDAQDNIYVTDSDAGKIFVFDADGKLRRVMGSLRGGEGFFKRPTGIAVDSAAQRIFVSDTYRNQIFVMDMQGSILQKFGTNGSGDGEFNFPTELRLAGNDLIVVDAMNFRIQVLDRSGTFRYAIGQVGDREGWLFRPKGVGVDSEGHLYVVDGLYNLVQVFDRQGQLLYYFGQRGTGFGEFQLPAGLFIDRSDRVLVVDSYNRRVQVFQYFGLGRSGAGGIQ